MMSAFKEMVARDRNVVLNGDEFGELHEIEGEEITCVIDAIEAKESKGGTEYATAQSCKVLFAKCEDLPRRKGYGAELMVDGIPYTVQSWDEDGGIATITLGIDVNV